MTPKLHNFVRVSDNLLYVLEWFYFKTHHLPN